MSIKSSLAGVALSAAAVTIPFLPVQPLQAAMQAPSTQPVLMAAATQKAPSDTALWLMQLALIAGGSAATLLILASLMFRRVVGTNMVHVVQSRKTTVAYGTRLKSGNVYYEVPAWVPGLGVSVIKLPVNNFELTLKDYDAYDEDRVPFQVDVTAFFRIDSPEIAAQRITDYKELQNQLTLIVKGAVRKVLASDTIDNIMTQRSSFGDSFSSEVKEQLAEWGVIAVKNMELMDIRDSPNSAVISNISAKKESEYERDSRITVAQNVRLAEVAEEENRQTAQIAKVDANKAIDLAKEAASQETGERSATKDKAVGIAKEQSQQQILIQQAETKEKELAVARVNEIKKAEIERDQALVQAERDQKVAAIEKETALVRATQDKETTVTVAEGQLEADRKRAEAIEATGRANAAAEEALQLAPVTAQVTLAKEIGSNSSYQQFLTLVEAIKAYIAVGTEQAKSLQGADIKVIANGGSASEGVSNVLDIFSSKGGTSIAAAIEGFAQSEFGAEILSRIATAPAPKQ